MKRTIVIDLDGPILDGRLKHYRCYAEIAQSLGVTPLTIETYWEAKRSGKSAREQLEMSGGAGKAEEFASRWIAEIESRPRLELDAVQPGAVEVLGNWHPQGKVVALTTMRRDLDNLEWQLARLDLRRWFTHVIPVSSGSKHDAVKRSPLRIEPADSVWIGDTEADILSAQAMSIPVYAVTCGLRNPEFLAKLHPDFQVADLRAVEAAIA